MQCLFPLFLRNYMNKVSVNYRIYSINRPGRLLNFWTLREALIRGLALIKFFIILSKCSMFILQQNNLL